MKTKSILFALVFAATASFAQTNSAVPLPPPGYKLVWSDEFEEAQLDPAKWDFRTDSKMWSTQLPQNVSVHDGKLFLAVKKEDVGDKHYTGAGVISKQAFKYGYYEARFKVPPGAGWHTSFWMQKHDGAGGTDPQVAAQELDVCENDSFHPNYYSVNVHKWNPKPHVAMGHKIVKTPNLSEDFHIFGCEFTPATVKYYFDGQLVRTVSVTNFVHGDQNIWLTTIACNLGHTKSVDDSKLPSAAEYDYVRFYEPVVPDFANLHNPVWSSRDNLRDPSVLKSEDGYHLFYSRVSNGSGGMGNPTNWHVAEVVTRDFITFTNEHDVSPAGCASPGDVIFWHGRYLLPFQSYPAWPTQLEFSESPDLKSWSAPKAFLSQARFLPWNTRRRVIDPTLVMDGDVLHCFFVGSASVTNSAGKIFQANLLGHAITRDPKLENWEILSTNAPLMGVSERAPDGVENIMVLHTGNRWTMIYSEGLVNQHLALATSSDLSNWKLKGPIELPRQKWMARKYGAPFVWRDGSVWRMILMGENFMGHTTFGLLTSVDGEEWTLLPE